MDENYLINTCNQLNKVSEKSANEYTGKADKLILVMNNEIIKRADIESLVGVQNIDMMHDNHANHIRFISSILKNFHATVFVETILWVFRAYRSRGFSTNYWATQLNTWIKILKKELSEDAYKEIAPYYDWMQISIPLFVKLSDEKLDIEIN